MPATFNSLVKKLAHRLFTVQCYSQLVHV